MQGFTEQRDNSSLIHASERIIDKSEKGVGPTIATTVRISNSDQGVMRIGVTGVQPTDRVGPGKTSARIRIQVRV
jgi:hypothetical protein